jgi:predicted SAM-dependent methyltransferase
LSGFKINLGSGGTPLPGFLNVDALSDAPGVDLVADISKPLPLEDGSAELIYASHVLEHFPHDETLAILRDWRRVLHDGGNLYVAVPNLEVIADMLLNRSGWFTPPHSPWVGAIYGGQKDEYDFHKAGFTPGWLTYLLTEAGFGNVQKVDRFAGLAAHGVSYSVMPFGINVSLNMIAVAGPHGSVAELMKPAPLEQAFFRVDRLFEHALNISSSVRTRLMNRRRRRIERAIERQP